MENGVPHQQQTAHNFTLSSIDVEFNSIHHKAIHIAYFRGTKTNDEMPVNLL